MKKLMKTVLAPVALSALAFSAVAQDADWPSKPIRFVVPYSAGGPADAIARMVGNHISDTLGQPVIVDNRPGGNNNIGTEYVARAAPDGYTILYVTTSNVLNPAVLKVSVDPVTELDPVSTMTVQPYILMSRKGGPKTLPAILEAAKQKEGITCANGGGMPYFGCQWLRAITKDDGAEITNVTYKGNGPAMAALLGGHVDILIDLTNTAFPQIEAGNVNAVALTSPKRLPNSDLPVMAETIEGFSLVGWHGVMVPKGTPKPIVEKLNDALGKAMKDPEIVKYLDKARITISHITPEEFGKIIKDDVQKYIDIAERAGIEKQ